MTLPDEQKSTTGPAASAGGAVAQRGDTTGALGMRIFLLSLTVLFAASLTGYLLMRARSDAWPPPNMPRLPKGLWVSTIVIVLCSVSIHAALVSIRRNRYGALIGAVLITLLLGVVFLVSQALNWAWLMVLHATAGTGLYMFTFYLLTGLHGAHVVGGLAALTVVARKAIVGRYGADDHRGVKYAAMYWHFLGGVWMVMFVLIFLI